MEKTTVSVVRNTGDVRAAVRRSVELLGGMSAFVKKGESVLIKPNLIYPAPPPLTTDPRVTDAVIELVTEAGASRIIVGEGGAPVPKTMDGFTVMVIPQDRHARGVRETRRRGRLPRRRGL